MEATPAFSGVAALQHAWRSTPLPLLQPSIGAAPGEQQLPSANLHSHQMRSMMLPPSSGRHQPGTARAPPHLLLQEGLFVRRRSLYQVQYFFNCRQLGFVLYHRVQYPTARIETYLALWAPASVSSHEWVPFAARVVCARNMR